MQRQRQNPNKSLKKNPTGKPKNKSKTPMPPIYILPNYATDEDDQSSVYSNSSLQRRIAGEEDELRIREELEEEIERELEQELVDGISALVRRLSELKARQIVRGIGMSSFGGAGFPKKAETRIAGATRRWVAENFSQREGVVNLGAVDGCSSGCSDAESTTESFLRKRR